MLKIHNNKVLLREYIMYFHDNRPSFVCCLLGSLFFCFVVIAFSILLFLFVVVGLVCLFCFCTVDRINKTKILPSACIMYFTRDGPSFVNFPMCFAR